jgi:hypothetical protein
MQQQGIAVRLRLGRARGAEGAAGAADILDDHLLTERLGHGFGDQPRDRVGRPAGRERHDDGDRIVRIVLRQNRRGRHRRQANQQECSE